MQKLFKIRIAHPPPGFHVTIWLLNTNQAQMEQRVWKLPSVKFGVAERQRKWHSTFCLSVPFKRAWRSFSIKGAVCIKRFNAYNQMGCFQLGTFKEAETSQRFLTLWNPWREYFINPGCLNQLYFFPPFAGNRYHGDCTWGRSSIRYRDQKGIRGPLSLWIYAVLQPFFKSLAMEASGVLWKLTWDESFSVK